jgi:hypothetical protein
MYNQTCAKEVKKIKTGSLARYINLRPSEFALRFFDPRAAKGSGA